MCYCKAPWLLYKLGWINKSLSLTDWILLVEFIIYLQKSLHNYSNHLNTKHLNIGFIWIPDSMGVWYSNGSVTWLGRQFGYRTFGPEIGFFSPVFRPPFKYRTIRQPNTNLPIEFQTSPVFEYSGFNLFRSRCVQDKTRVLVLSFKRFHDAFADEPVKRTKLIKNIMTRLQRVTIVAMTSLAKSAQIFENASRGSGN